MRKLLAFGLVVALVVVILGVADVVVRHTAERDIARHIESAVPGTTAAVHISSWPFVGRIAASGTIRAFHVTVSGVKVGPFAVDSVDLAVQDIKVSRSELLRGKVVLQSIRSAAITGVISQQSVDSGSGLPLTLGAGTVGLAGVQVPARIAVSGGRLLISVAPLPAIALPLLPAALVPCAAAAIISPGQITVSCTTSSIPPALISAVASGG